MATIALGVYMCHAKARSHLHGMGLQFNIRDTRIGNETIDFVTIGRPDPPPMIINSVVIHTNQTLPPAVTGPTITGTPTRLIATATCAAIVNNRISVHLNTHAGGRVHEARGSVSSTSSSSDRSSISSVEPTPSSSLMTSPSRSSPVLVSASKPVSAKGKGKELTPSQLYESLLLGGFGCEVGCELAIPLWKPSPRVTRGGHKYTIEIGDVGVFSDGLPFHTLFNIIQPKDSMANRNRVPEGVDPPCEIEDDSFTVFDNYHRAGTTLTKPRGSISHQRVQGNKALRIFTFDLSQEEGALLMLPRGASLEKLAGTEELKRRVKRYWREWYKFAGNRGDGGRKALFVVTGVAKCSMWAIAVWDLDTSDNLRSLKLDVDGGTCSWSFSPAMCYAHSSPDIPTDTANQLKETVFVGGFWVNRGIVPKPPSVRSGDDGSGHEEDNTDQDEDHRDHEHSRDLPPNDSSYSFLPMSQPSASGGGYSGSSRAPFDPADSSNESQVDELELSLSVQDFDQYRPAGPPPPPPPPQDNRPCEVINKFALALISKACPALLDAGCIAFSHDDDWISVAKDGKDSELEFPPKTELIRRISSTLKFVVEQGKSTHNGQSQIDCLPATMESENVITALVEFREPEVMEEAPPGCDTLRTAVLESDNTPKVTSTSFEDTAQDEQHNNQIPQPDPQIIEALNNKDRAYVLKLGELMEETISDRKERMEVNPTTGNQRMLVHRASAYYRLKPEERLQEDVCLHSLMGKKSALADLVIVELLDWARHQDSIDVQFNEPTVFSTLSNSPIVNGINKWYDNDLKHGVSLRNGQTRVTLNDPGSTLCLRSNQYHSRKAWLSQVWSVFHAHGISLKDDLRDYKLIVPDIWLNLSISPSEHKRRQRHQQPIFLFVRPLPSTPLHSHTTTSLHYWSFYEDGQSPLSTSTCHRLGLPVELELRVSFGVYTWSNNVYKTMQKYQAARGFDPSTVEFARSLGYGYEDPAYKPTQNVSDRFEEIDMKELGEFNSVT
ncbi:hypothetical protein V5O48_014164 [Marasmius crinis-equi]|uniref:R3H domain-containing protein n=1 Tax=Marasmius crinis-equi TaxID=585013 RepID=A0ABR3EY35_9AGAR